MKWRTPSLILTVLGVMFSVKKSIKSYFPSKKSTIPSIRFFILIKLASYSKTSPWNITHGLSSGTISHLGS